MMDNFYSKEQTSETYFKKLKEQKLESGFIVPNDYFDCLMHDILSRVRMDAINDKSKSDGYIVPDKYFDQLGSQILNRISNLEKEAENQTKVIQIWHSNLLKYACAACFVLVTAYGIYFNQLHNNLGMTTPITLSNDDDLLNIDEQVIVEDIQSDNNRIQTITSATNLEIESYILNNYSQNDILGNLELNWNVTVYK